MTVLMGSLFTGAGGLDMGVAAAIRNTTGLKTRIAWVSDIDPGPRKVLSFRYPKIPNIGDVTKVDWNRVTPVDVLTGGSPCQDLSLAGARKGMTAEGRRSNLWVAMREAVAVLRPRLVCWENVLGSLSARADSSVEPCPGCVGDGSSVHLRALGRVVGDLSSLGYDCRWQTVSAASVGAPHLRKRVFLIAYPSDSKGGRRGFRVAANVRPPTGESNTSGDTTGLPSHSICESGIQRREPDPGETTGEKPFRITTECDRAPLRTLPTPTARDWKGQNQRHDQTSLTGALLPTPTAHPSGNSPEEHLRKKPGRTRITDLGILAENRFTHLPTPRTTDASNSATAPSAMAHAEAGFGSLPEIIGYAGLGEYESACNLWANLLGRAWPPPLIVKTRATPKHPNRPPTKPLLNPRFTEWMMGLPDGWVCDVPGITRAEALRLCGNGVVPQQAAAAYTHLLKEAFS